MKWSKFAKIRTIQKLPAQQINKLTTSDKFKYDPKAKSIFVSRPEIGSQFKQESAAKFARGVEYKKLESGLKKIRDRAMKMFSSTKFYTTKPGTNFKIKTATGKATLDKINKAKTQAVKTARAAGLRALQKRSAELNVGIKKFGSQKSKFVQKFTEAESRELGFPPRDAVFKSTKKVKMTNVDKTLSEFANAEKFNPKTKKFETIRTYNIASSSSIPKVFKGYDPLLFKNDSRRYKYDPILKGYIKKKK
jgi:hypothetical protein